LGIVLLSLPVIDGGVLSKADVATLGLTADPASAEG